MKNHLSMELSMGAGGSSWFWGRGGSWSGETRLAEWPTVRLVLSLVSFGSPTQSEGGNLRGNAAGGGLARDELLPGLAALADDVHGVLLVLALAGEGELVLGLAVGDLVDAEPLVGGAQQARQVALDVLDVVELGSQRVVDVNDDDLPVGLLLVQQRHDAEHLDLLDLADVADQLADLAHVERVVVALGLGLGVDRVGVLPGLLQLATTRRESIF